MTKILNGFLWELFIYRACTCLIKWKLQSRNLRKVLGQSKSVSGYVTRNTPASSKTCYIVKYVKNYLRTY